MLKSRNLILIAYYVAFLLSCTKAKDSNDPKISTVDNNTKLNTVNDFIGKWDRETYCEEFDPPFHKKNHTKMYITFNNDETYELIDQSGRKGHAKWSLEHGNILVMMNSYNKIDSYEYVHNISKTRFDTKSAECITTYNKVDK